MSRSLLIIATALALATPAAAAQTWSPITFKSAFGDEVAAEQTTVTVAENPAKPNGAVVKLPVVRFRSTSAHPGPPIVYIAGGPGGSGLVTGRQDFFPVFMRLREAGDVVLWDQRGTGAAEPSLGLKGVYDLPGDKSLKSPEAAARLVQIAQDGAAEIRRRGIDLSTYNTAQNAEDLDAVRQALGVQAMVLWGHSYGSHLGLAYLKAHPEHVTRAVFGGVNDLGNRWRYPSDNDALLARIDAAIKADPGMARRIPDFLGMVRRVMDGLAAHPGVAMVGGKPSYLGREELQTVIALQAGDLQFIRDLPQMFAELDKGQTAKLAAGLMQLRLQPTGGAMQHAMHLASGVAPARAARIARETPGSLSGDAINFPYNNPAFAAAWGVPDLGEGFRRPTPSDVPVLFMNAEFDGRTSVREAKETASRFRRGAFSEMGGVSHNFYGFNPAVAEAMLGWIEHGRAPAARIQVLPTEFRSPDEAELIAALIATLKARGAPAAAAEMKALAVAREGPYLNAITARTLSQRVAQDLKDPAAALVLIRAGLELYPDDWSLTRQLAMVSRAAGDKATALAAFQAVKRINPMTPGVDVDIAKLR